MAGTGTDTDADYGATQSTLLVLRGMGVTPFSARGLTQTLDPITAALDQRRTVNGELLDLSVAELRKYTSTISGNDQDVPPLDGVFPGTVMEMDCITELAYKVGGAPSRPVVPGSERTADDFVFYRPRLQVMLVGSSVDRDEWGATVSWSIQVEEV